MTADTNSISISTARESDIPQLAELNLQLMEDERHLYMLPIEELRARMTRWVAGEYHVLVFRNGARICGYAAWCPEERGTYLRHFFICRDQRRQGLGRTIIDRLRRDHFPKDQPLQLEATIWNTDAIAFWRAIGFKDFGLTLEMKPEETVT
jgi:GNAT superfamily N-acetyltransferase